MKQTDLTSEWAWSQVEAAADGSLSRADRRRMQVAMARDQRLRIAVRRAQAVRRQLRQLAPVPIPAGLSRRLLRISAGWSGEWLWATGPAVTAVAAIMVAGVLLESEPPPADPRLAALQEFSVAMHYLRKTAVLTSDEVTDVLGDGLRSALSISRTAMVDEQSRGENGG